MNSLLVALAHLLVAFAEGTSNDTEEGDATRDLFSELFSQYRKEIRPVLHPTRGPTNVTVQLFIKQIQKVEESDQTLTLYCWLEMYWTDEHLRWNPAEHNGTADIIVPAQMIWRPDLLIYNNANMNIREKEMETNAVIRHNGKVTMFRAMITELTCDLHMENFPFDQQICFIMLSSWSYDGSGIMLDTVVNVSRDNSQSSLKEMSTLKHYLPSAEWYLNDFKVRRNLKYYGCCEHPYPDITYFFSIKRNPIYYLFTQLIPSTFITIVTIIGSFTPHSSTGENQEKVTLGVTALLSLAIILMMVADKLPATSNDLPLLGKFYVGLIFIMFAATCFTTVTLAVQMRGNLGKKVPHRVRSLINASVLGRIFFQRLPGTLEKKWSLSRTPANYENIWTKERDPSNEFFTEVPTCEILQCRLLTAIDSVRSAVSYMRRQGLERDKLEAARKEWATVARGLDKIFMVIFSGFTLCFACALFLHEDEQLRITDEYMDILAQHSA